MFSIAEQLQFRLVWGHLGGLDQAVCQAGLEWGVLGCQEGADSEAACCLCFVDTQITAT